MAHCEERKEHGAGEREHQHLRAKCRRRGGRLMKVRHDAVNPKAAW
jgi:hypothetical protein